MSGGMRLSLGLDTRQLQVQEARLIQVAEEIGLTQTNVSPIAEARRREARIFFDEWRSRKFGRNRDLNTIRKTLVDFYARMDEILGFTQDRLTPHRKDVEWIRQGVLHDVAWMADGAIAIPCDEDLAFGRGAQLFEDRILRHDEQLSEKWKRNTTGMDALGIPFSIGLADELRYYFASLTNARPEDVAIVPTTTAGMQLALAMAGAYTDGDMDHIVFSDECHISSIVAAMLLGHDPDNILRHDPFRTFPNFDDLQRWLRISPEKLKERIGRESFGLFGTYGKDSNEVSENVRKVLRPQAPRIVVLPTVSRYSGRGVDLNQVCYEIKRKPYATEQQQQPQDSGSETREESGKYVPPVLILDGAQELGNRGMGMNLGELFSRGLADMAVVCAHKQLGLNTCAAVIARPGLLRGSQCQEALRNQALRESIPMPAGTFCQSVGVQPIGRNLCPADLAATLAGFQRLRRSARITHAERGDHLDTRYMESDRRKQREILEAAMLEATDKKWMHRGSGQEWQTKAHWGTPGLLSVHFPWGDAREIQEALAEERIFVPYIGRPDALRFTPPVEKIKPRVLDAIRRILAARTPQQTPKRRKVGTSVTVQSLGIPGAPPSAPPEATK
jgi:hypothetical protein